MKEWTTGELRVLRLFASLGAKGVGTLLGRSAESVSVKARRLGVSLAPTGEDINVDQEVLTLLARVSETSQLQICPMCGKRWATMRDTGICKLCHLDRLISIHQEQLEIEVRQRALTAARKEKQRRLADEA